MNDYHRSDRLKASIESHIEHDTFYCPNAFDLSFWGMKGDLDSKTLTLDFSARQAEKLDGKSLLLLINNKKAVEVEKESEPGADLVQIETALEIRPFTSMHWLPLSAKAPQLTTITFTRELLYKTQTEQDRLFGRPLQKEQYLSSVRDASSITYTPFPYHHSQPSVVASLDFQLSYDLYIEAPKNEQNVLDSIALAGGVYIILITIVGFLFSAFVPYFMHLYIIRTLFKVDNNPRKKPQSQQKMAEKNHGNLVKEAKDSHKYRVRLTTSGCDSCMLIFESVIRVLTCGKNRWSRTVQEGVKQIKGELDIFNYMRRLRMTAATVNALTTFNQRRLLEAQVETSFLLQPLKKKDASDDD